MAAGDITSITIRADGWSADVVFEGLATGGTYANGFGANNTPSTGTPRFTLSLTSPGFDQAGNATTRARVAYGTICVRKPYPDNATKDETSAGGFLTARIALSDPIFSGDTSITANVLSAFLTSGGTPNNPVTGLAVTNNSTLAYPKVVGRWVWPCFERVTGDFPLEMYCAHPYGRDNMPVACVKFDAQDESANAIATQTVTSMVISPRGGDALPVPVYRTVVPVSGLTQAHVITCQFKAFPWIGDAASCLDSRTSADGVAAPSANLTPLLAYLDKLDARACYASVDGVGAGTPACSTTKAGARANPYSTIALAMAALKTFNNTTFGDNSLNNCVILMQNGTYTGPGTFTGSNTKSYCEIVADTENGATEAGVVISTALNQVCAAYLKLKDVTLSGSSSGILRGSSSSGVLWLDSITGAATAAAWQYNWQAVHGTRNTFTSAANQTHNGANPSPWVLQRGNSCSLHVSTHAYCVIGCTNYTGSWQETGNTPGHAVSDNVIWAHNRNLAMTGRVANAWATSTNITKGLAFVGNLVERITDTTQPVVQIAADNTTSAITRNVYLMHNTIAGERCNLNYQDAGTTTYIRENWFDLYNCFQDSNTKTDVFGTPSGARVGNWAFMHGVGCKGSRFEKATFPRDFAGLDVAVVGESNAMGYTANNSVNGANTGNGDYTLTVSSPARNRVPAGGSIVPFDVAGTTRDNNGGGSSGALQRVGDIIVITSAALASAVLIGIMLAI